MADKSVHSRRVLTPEHHHPAKRAKLTGKQAVIQKLRFDRHHGMTSEASDSKIQVLTFGRALQSN